MFKLHRHQAQWQFSELTIHREDGINVVLNYVTMLSHVAYSRIPCGALCKRLKRTAHKCNFCINVLAMKLWIHTSCNPFNCFFKSGANKLLTKRVYNLFFFKANCFFFEFCKTYVKFFITFCFFNTESFKCFTPFALNFFYFLRC